MARAVKMWGDHGGLGYCWSSEDEQTDKAFACLKYTYTDWLTGVFQVVSVRLFLCLPRVTGLL